MTITNTQNRPYDDTKPLMVRAHFSLNGKDDILVFNWNDRTEVRNFAAQSDRIIRAGGRTHLGPAEAL